MNRYNSPTSVGELKENDLSKYPTTVGENKEKER